MNFENFETIGDLKKALDTLNEEQLNQKIRMWYMEEAATIKGLFSLEEDYYNPGGDGYAPLSDCINNDDGITEESLKADGEDCLPRGTIIFDFESY